MVYHRNEAMARLVKVIGPVPLCFETAIIEGTYLAVKYMGTQNGGKGGVVVNAGSISGLRPHNLAAVYVASKHGVIGFTRSVALEPDMVRNGVRVVAKCPNTVDTTLISIALEKGVKYTKELKQDIAGRAVNAKSVLDHECWSSERLYDTTDNNYAKKNHYVIIDNKV
ncbi:15-hydroxyprostaglandin dehydrogenase [NAD(+)]-like [Saccoglossus kowalevskii]|uniref:15-hydroxyprostaglandin dehydrogenase [NAD(+)] n=1 Tax=Saccoglossus kowalevskii TaxID=10224 RepID=A0ABM0MTB2_SACKO|nr:PREDICTED: 15-hydroxyprostaglandin dehydrogenase [NAD(+)]-like [Saccoglossus kowalevskii]